MTGLRIITTAGLLAFALSMPAAAAGEDGRENPSFIIVEVSSVKEQVVEIDHKSRMVTLKDDEGKVRTVKVGPQARNLYRVNKGDMVTIDLDETISVEVQPGPGNTMNIGMETQTGAQPGAKPSGKNIIEGKLKTEVARIDHEARTITFKDRKGVLKTYKVGPQAKRFEEIRRGDMLVIEYKQTIAVSVQ